MQKNGYEAHAGGRRRFGEIKVGIFQIAFVCLCVVAGLSGCLNRQDLPPVFSAVFGVTGAPERPFTQGRLPEQAVMPNSRLVGAAAANPGACIWQDAAGRRFRAACPEGSDGLKPRP